MTTMPRQKPGLSDQDLETPDDLIEAVKRLLHIDEFSLDLAANEYNTQADNWIGPPGGDPLDLPEGCVGLDSLTQSWHWRGWLWLNPPFGRITPWVEKCAEYSTARTIALLVPAAVGSNWWRDYVQPYAAVHHLNGRPKFEGYEGGYPKDLSLCLYGPGFLPASRSWDWRHQP